MARLARSVDVAEYAHAADKAITALFSSDLNPEDPRYKALFAAVEKLVIQERDAELFGRMMDELRVLRTRAQDEQDSIDAANKKRKTEERYADEDQQKAQVAQANVKSEYREPIDVVAQILVELFYHQAQLQLALQEQAQVEHEAAAAQNQFAQQVGAHLANQGVVLQNGQVVRLPANAPQAVAMQNRLQGQPRNPLQLVQGLPEVHEQYLAQRNAALGAQPQPRPAAARQNRAEEAEQAIQAAIHANRVALERLNARNKHKELIAARIVEAMRARAHAEGHHLGGDFDGCVMLQLGASFDNFFSQMSGLFDRAIAAEARVNHHAACVGSLMQRLGHSAGIIGVDMSLNNDAAPEYKFGR